MWTLEDSLKCLKMCPASDTINSDYDMPEFKANKGGVSWLKIFFEPKLSQKNIFFFFDSNPSSHFGFVKKCVPYEKKIKNLIVSRLVPKVIFVGKSQVMTWLDWTLWLAEQIRNRFTFWVKLSEKLAEKSSFCISLKCRFSDSPYQD